MLTVRSQSTNWSLIDWGLRSWLWLSSSFLRIVIGDRSYDWCTLNLSLFCNIYLHVGIILSLKSLWQWSKPKHKQKFLIKKSSHISATRIEVLMWAEALHSIWCTVKESTHCYLLTLKKKFTIWRNFQQKNMISHTWWCLYAESQRLKISKHCLCKELSCSSLVIATDGPVLMKAEQRTASNPLQSHDEPF